MSTRLLLREEAERVDMSQPGYVPSLSMPSTAAAGKINRLHFGDRQSKLGLVTGLLTLAVPADIT